jgi:hypothetical protein
VKSKGKRATARGRKAGSKERKTYVVLNDIQIPFHDEEVLFGLVVPFVRELRPHGVVLNGDIVDNYEISDFTKDPKLRRMDLRAEREGLDRLLTALAPVTKALVRRRQP